MATVAREFSLDYYLLDRLKFSGLDKENLADLVSIVVSLKNKYGIVPYAIAPHGDPVPNAIAASYLIESITLNKLINVLLDTPRLERVTVVPRGIPRSPHFELKVTLGG
jgi:hypothetical protein